MGKNVIKIAAFGLIFCLLFQGFTHVYSFKDNPGITGMKSFYMQENDSIDVIFVGSSVVFDGINTGVLWNEQGIAAFDLAGAAQPIWNSYFFINEALKTQSLKLVVLEVYASGITEDYLDSSRVIGNNFGLKLSPDYIDSLEASSEKEGRFDYLLRFPTYHTRYEELSKTDFQEYNKNYKGFQYLTGSRVESVRPEGFETDETGEMTEKNEVYLRKICELCRDKKVPLLLIKTPYQADLEETKIFNRAAKIAAEYDVPFVNFNYYYDDMGISFPTHFYDTFHLNGKGSEIFTSYLAEYLKENYEIPDRRGEDGYETYDIMSKESYLSKSYNESVVDACDLETFISLIQNPDYVTVYSLSGDCWDMTNYDEVKGILEVSGMNIDGLRNEGGAAWVVQNQQVVYRMEEAEWHTELNRYDSMSVSLNLNESGKNTWRAPEIRFNHNTYNKTDSGLNICVYDTVTETIVDAVCFEIDNGELQCTKG